MKHPHPLPRTATTTHWLVTRLGHLGDVALTTGVLRWWGERHNMRFHVLTKPAWAPLFHGHPYVEKTIPFPEHAHSLHGAVPFFRQLAAAHKGWGLLDLHGVPRTRLLRFLWRGPVAAYPKMGLQRRVFMATRLASVGGALATLRVPQRYALALENTPPPIADLLPEVWLEPQEHNMAQALLAPLLPVSSGTPVNAPVALHPFAAHKWKTWPANTWRALAATLQEQGIPYVIIGQGTPLLPGQTADLTNQTTLRETCAVLAACRCLVTGDSGPMHLASAVQTPVVALFGPTTPHWGFYPAGPCDTVLERPLPCRPCSLHGKANCPRAGQCLQEILPAHVVKAILQTPEKSHLPDSPVNGDAIAETTCCVHAPDSNAIPDGIKLEKTAGAATDVKDTGATERIGEHTHA